jgi:outer membrane protein TolC
MLLVLVSALAGPPRASAQGTFSMQPLGARPAASASIEPPGRFLGGVPSGEATHEPVGISLEDAIARALRSNLGVLTAEQGMDEARGARWKALSDLLPNVNGRIAETRQKINLQAFGLPSSSAFPDVVGPFNTFDARVYLSQALLDLRAVNDARAESHRVAAAGYSYKGARDLVVLVTANLYLQALGASARADSAVARFKTAEALHVQTLDLKQGGLVAGIDVLRAEVELSTEHQRATASRNDYEKSKLRLARVVGLPIGQSFTMSDQLPTVPVPDVSIDQALDGAYRKRPDYLAALERVRAAEASRRAVMGETLPAVHVNADYGSLGLTPANARGTYSLAGSVSVPIFNGGRTYGRLLEADAELRRRRAEADDIKASIYYDVRSALLDLQAQGELMQAATGARDLATRQLGQARDRFAAGVAGNLEVVQAQETVAVAEEQYISALYGYGLAKAMLAYGLGQAEDTSLRMLGGAR